MRRFFVDKTEPIVLLKGEEHYHLSKVLRAHQNERVILCDGDNYDHIYNIEKIEKNVTLLKEIETVENKCNPKTNVTVYSALMKGDKQEIVAQKFTELGVKCISSFSSEFSVAKPSAAKTERIKKICVEAAKQCGRCNVPDVKESLSFSEMLKQLDNYDLIVFPYEGAREVSIRDYLNSVTKKINNVAVIVGSEGGFSKAEADALIEKGVQPLTLGNRILRAETANIVVVSIIMYVLGELEL